MKTTIRIMALLITLIGASAQAVETIYYYHNDQLGTPQKMTDANQTVVWDVDYLPFGLAVGTASIENNLRFPGQYYDKESGLHYNYFRDYDPRIGRYMQSDPIGLAGGINTYGYVGGNPLIYYDSLGLDYQVTIWQGVGWGSSSFGHASGSINGNTWSFGPNGMTTMSQTDFNSANSFRNGVTSNIPLTPEQDIALAEFLSKFNDDYDAISNNCTAPIQQGLQQIGIDLGNFVLPVSLGNAILDSGVANEFTFQFPSQTPDGASAPWTK